MANPGERGRPEGWLGVSGGGRHLIELEPVEVGNSGCGALEGEVEIVQAGGAGYGRGYGLPGLPTACDGQRCCCDQRAGYGVEMELNGAALACAGGAHTDRADGGAEVDALI